MYRMARTTPRDGRPLPVYSWEYRCAHVGVATSFGLKAMGTRGGKHLLRHSRAP